MKKIMLISLIFFIALIIALYTLDFTPTKTSWGVTFSQQYATDELKLDWRETYLAILDDLRVDHLRLVAYWNHNEPHPGQDNFSDLDWQVNEASQRGVKIILAVGRRLPRWPECHEPGWTENMTTAEVEQKQLAFMERVVKRYRDNPQIIAWQVENEPFLQLFGVCPAPDPKFLRQEIALVRSLSPKPIMITDSGELSTWYNAASIGGDILGTTLYRVVYNPTVGYFHWFVPPSYYYFKTQIIKALTGTKRVIIAEMQGEAWHKAGTDLGRMTLDQQFESINLKQFQTNIVFARQTGLDEVYLWGAEWWYFLKIKLNYPAFWDEAKKLWVK